MIFRDVEDRDLILRARKGDVESYNILVSHWEKRVYNYILRVVGNRDDALDLCQDTFLKAYRGIAKLNDPARFPQWLFRIAHNETTSMYRRKKPVVEDENLEQSVDPASLARARFDGMTFGAAELGLAVEQALERLSGEQRQVVLLKVYQGFKFAEIAKITGCPSSTVKSRFYSALNVLQGALAMA